MSYNESKKPLHFQNPDLRKGNAANPSFESFRPNVIHEVQYSEMDDRASTHAMASMRRYPNGELDYQWAVSVIMDAIHKAERGMYLTPVEEAMITVVFPLKYRATEPMQAEIRTKLSSTEKSDLKELVEAQIKEELNYNAGNGGGSVPGRTRSTT